MTAASKKNLPDSTEPEDRSPAQRIARVVAWLLSVALVVLAAVLFAGWLPPDRLASIGLDRESVRVGAILMTLAAVFANTLAFRPPRGSSQTGGPMPRYQGERLGHIIATVLPMIAVMKALGLF